MARPGTTEPDLVGDLRAIKGRLDALERKPVPQASFDQYPTVEWATSGRPSVFDNQWTSCGVANVTGLKYDRIEVKYITDMILKDRSEAEIRMAAFRHEAGTQFKECISASQTVRLVGVAERTLGVGKWRWMHGIEFGWDYTDADNAIYTVELQHRNPDDCQQKGDVTENRQFLTYSKGAKDANPGFRIRGTGEQYWALEVRENNGSIVNYGWHDIPLSYDPWDGAYAISNMHYCVGMSQERLPGATPNGWHWYTGNSRFVRPPNINEPYFQF